MIRTTRAQREALFRVFQRDFPSWVSPGKRLDRRAYRSVEEWLRDNPNYGSGVPPRTSIGTVPVPTTQWRRFRKTVQPHFGSGCVMVPWAGMWLGIEEDGYTHS